MAINKNAFKPLSQFLRKQQICCSFKLCAPCEPGVID